MTKDGERGFLLFLISFVKKNFKKKKKIAPNFGFLKEKKMIFRLQQKNKKVFLEKEKKFSKLQMTSKT